MDKKVKAREVFLLDTSAILALHYGEDGAEAVEKILIGASGGRNKVMASFVSFMEFLYIVWRDFGDKVAKTSYIGLNILPIERVGYTEEIILKAAEFKATMEVSFADAWIAATAFVNSAQLVHKDPELSVFEKILRQISLPLKK